MYKAVKQLKFRFKRIGMVFEHNGKSIKKIDYQIKDLIDHNKNIDVYFEGNILKHKNNNININRLPSVQIFSFKQIDKIVQA